MLTRKANRDQARRLKAMDAYVDEMVQDPEHTPFLRDLVDCAKHQELKIDLLHARVLSMEELWANADVLVLDAINQTRGVVGAQSRQNNER